MDKTCQLPARTRARLSSSAAARVLAFLLGATLAVACGAGRDTTATQDPKDSTTTSSTRTVNQAKSTNEPKGTTDTAVPVELESIASDLVKFALGDDLAIETVPLADEVALVLHDKRERTVAGPDLWDRGEWTIDVDGYAELDGPFNALSTIANRSEPTVTVGPHRHCAGPPLEPPAGYENHTRLSIQPTADTASPCMFWYAVDMFYNNESGDIDAVSLELFGP